MVRYRHLSAKENLPRTGSKVKWQDNGCFVCGPENPIGLRLEFELDRKNLRATSRVTFKPEHQGWDGVVHGGIIAAVLDDVMAYAIMTTDNLAITTRLSLTYRKPVLVGEIMYLEGVIVKLGTRTAVTHGVLFSLVNDGNGEKRMVKCKSEGTYFLDHPMGGEVK